MPHEIVFFPNGLASVKNPALGEAMHSRLGPMAEARAVYLEPTRLRARLSHPSTETFHLFDLGVGIAANAIAAIDCRRGLPETARPLQIWSFEKDLAGLQLAHREQNSFPWIAEHAGAVQALLEKGEWRDEGHAIQWHLRGDFFDEELATYPAPEAIFFDFYSPKTTPELWSLEVFTRLRRVCANRPCLLSTYSAATRVRAALILAGFEVGQGGATALKRETTVAATRRDDLENPLGKEWLEKFERSGKALPEDIPRAEEALARLRVREILTSSSLELFRPLRD